MFRTLILLVVIMGAPAAFVNAESSNPDSARLKALVDRVLHGGFDDVIGPYLSPRLRFPGEMHVKSDGTDPDEAEDTADRNFEVVIDPSKSSAKPLALVCKAAHYGPKSSTNWVKLGLDGTPQLVMVETGRMENGKPVRGSGTATYLDLKSREAKAIIKYELDFWLRGMHRTKLGKLRLTNPKATQADVKASETK